MVFHIELSWCNIVISSQIEGGSPLCRVGLLHTSWEAGEAGRLDVNEGHKFSIEKVGGTGRQRDEEIMEVL